MDQLLILELTNVIKENINKSEMLVNEVRQMMELDIAKYGENMFGIDMDIMAKLSAMMFNTNSALDSLVDLFVEHMQTEHFSQSE